MINNIQNIVTDVDGVLTDGKFYYSSGGKVAKIFGPHDSDGIKIIKKLGIDVHAITADERGFVISSRRLSDLGLPLTLVKESERLDWLQQRYDSRSTLFVGDGIFDAKVMRSGFFGVCPADATRMAKKHASIVLKTKGGAGVMLELAELLSAEKNGRIHEEYFT